MLQGNSRGIKDPSRFLKWTFELSTVIALHHQSPFTYCNFPSKWFPSPLSLSSRFSSSRFTLTSRLTDLMMWSKSIKKKVQLQFRELKNSNLARNRTKPPSSFTRATAHVSGNAKKVKHIFKCVIAEKSSIRSCSNVSPQKLRSVCLSKLNCCFSFSELFAFQQKIV